MVYVLLFKCNTSIRYASSYLFQCYLLALVVFVVRGVGRKVGVHLQMKLECWTKTKPTPAKEFNTYETGSCKIKLIIMCSISSWYMRHPFGMTRFDAAVSGDTPPESPTGSLLSRWHWSHCCSKSYYRSSFDVKPGLYMLGLTWPS